MHVCDSDATDTLEILVQQSQWHTLFTLSQFPFVYNMKLHSEIMDLMTRKCIFVLLPSKDIQYRASIKKYIKIAFFKKHKYLIQCSFSVLKMFRY